jgi:uncharacterized repeat protein (TIGR04076 family)
MKVFKVRCRLIAFEGDEEAFPCHFNYKIGEEFYYDGVSFTGRICPNLLPSMTPAVYGVFLLGNKYFEDVMYRHRPRDARDPSMTEYDGMGFRPLPPPEPGPGFHRGANIVCGDTRTLAHFVCEAVDLSDSDYAQPFYRRAIAILEKIEAEPGIKTGEILGRFTDFQRNKISPVLTSALLDRLLEALADMDYIEVRDGRAHATGREPPSRPKYGPES